MKNGIALFLMVIILSVSLKDVFIYTNFFLNQDFIAKNKCVNRFVPKKTCYGRCQLNKAILKNHELDKKPQNTSKSERVEIVFVLSELTTKIFSTIGLHKKNSYRFYTENYNSTFSKSVFHPPSFI